MALTLATAKAAVAGSVVQGLQTIDNQLQVQFDADAPDAALILALNGLRAHYVFDQMRITRAAITAVDGSLATAQALTDLIGACDNLNAIQAASQATTAWINNASTALDKVFGFFSKLATL
jgi:hypothetical protein